MSKLLLEVRQANRVIVVKWLPNAHLCLEKY